MVSATLPERYAAVVRARGEPTRSACVRYGTSPDAPPDFTTLLVAYDIALSLTIGGNGASSSTNWNDARACRPRLSTPSATSASPIGSAAGPSDTTFPSAGRKSSAWVTTNHPTNTARTMPRMRGVQPVRRFTAGASSGVPENLMWTVSPMAGVTRASAQIVVRIGATSVANAAI